MIALLAFVGTLVSGDSGNGVRIENLVAPIRWFAFGVGLSATLAGLAYLVNVLDSDISNSVKFTWEHPYIEEDKNISRLRFIRAVLHVSALLTAVAILSAFFRGIFGVTDALLGSGL